MALLSLVSCLQHALSSWSIGERGLLGLASIHVLPIGMITITWTFAIVHSAFSLCFLGRRVIHMIPFNALKPAVVPAE